MHNLRIISLLILAGVSYASIVTDSATLKASRNLVTGSWCRHSSACDLVPTKVLGKILRTDVVKNFIVSVKAAYSSLVQQYYEVLVLMLAGARSCLAAEIKMKRQFTHYIVQVHVHAHTHTHTLQHIMDS